MKLLNDMYLEKQKIRHNIISFKQKFKKVKICAVVKADAYGHKIEGVVKCIDDLVDFYGVADSLEAVRTRKNTGKPILILCMTDNDSVLECINNKISFSVYSLKQIKKIENFAKKLNKKAKVHLAINSGMNRLGFDNKTNFLAAYNYIKKSCHLLLEGVYTHLFDSLDNKQNDLQLDVFKDYVKDIDTKNVILHISASNACLNKKYQLDMVRLGLMLYGYCDKSNALDLVSPLKITATIVNILQIKKGQYVGYGKNFIAQQNMKIAVVSMGYADGFLRANSNNGKVIIGGKFCNIVGNICMDLFMCDVSTLRCKIGDKATIVGCDKNCKISVEEIAQNTNTITYEVLTNFKTDRMNYHIV